MRLPPKFISQLAIDIQVNSTLGVWAWACAGEAAKAATTAANASAVILRVMGTPVVAGPAA
ncbi:hypothetical protein GCM10028813_12990 [Ramlibacter alkalitolerans]